MVLIKELLDKVVADHGQEISVANRAVLGLWDKYFLLLIFIILISVLIVICPCIVCLFVLLLISLFWLLRALIRGSHYSIFSAICLFLFSIVI